MIRRALVAAACALLVAASPILAAVLRLHGGSLGVFTFAVELPIAPVSVDIKPESLERRSQGSPVILIIESPEGAVDVRDIELASIRLCLEGPLCDAGVAVDGKPKVGDADGDGIRDLKVTFRRAGVLDLVSAIPAPSMITFVVSAVLSDGNACSGSDTVRLVDPDPDADGPSPSAGPEEGTPTPSDDTSASPQPPSPEPSPTNSEGPPAEPSPSESATEHPSGSPSPAPTAPDPTSPAASPTTPPAPTQTPPPTPPPSPTATPTPVPESTPTPEKSPNPKRNPKPTPTPEPTPTPDPAG